MHQHYRRLACSLYDRLEAFGVQQKPLHVATVHQGAVLHREVLVQNLTCKAGVEYLVTQDLTCRLDELLWIDDNWVNNRFWQEAEMVTRDLQKLEVAFPVQLEWDWNKALRVDMNRFAQDVEMNTSTMKSYVELLGYPYGWGGYGEYREVYRVNPENYGTGVDERTIHMGVDVWAEAGTPVLAAWDGVVFGLGDNAGLGNYGPTVIIEHQLDNAKFYSLYGHLSRTDLNALQIGQRVKKGEHIAHLGAWEENGNWPPHLHYQWITNMLGMVSDFHGVCSKRDWEFYSKLCPCPSNFIRD